MTLAQIAGLGRKLAAFLGLFTDCFGRREPRELLRVYVQGQLSAVHRKTAEGIALEFGKAPRTLQRFLESIKWDEEHFHDRCQELLAKNHGHPDAIGVVDESAVAKSGDDTVGVGRQWSGNRGKVPSQRIGFSADRRHNRLVDQGPNGVEESIAVACLIVIHGQPYGLDEPVSGDISRSCATGESLRIRHTISRPPGANWSMGGCGT